MLKERDSRVERFVSARERVLERDWSSVEPMGEMAAVCDSFLGELAAGEGRIALVAVGGYGRQEMGPHSDMDVVLLHEPRVNVERLTETIWYPVWDSRVALDYSVRTVAQAMRTAAADPRVLIGMLDARLVVGSEALFVSLERQVAERFRSQLEHYRGVFRAQAEERRQESGELAFLLEPDLKEAHGGLRDIVNLAHLLRVDPGQMGGPDALSAHRDFLLRVRNLLQARARRAQNRLLLQDQDYAAEAAGFQDADDLMARLAETGRFVSRALEENLAPAPRNRAHRRVAQRWDEAPGSLYLEGGELRLDPAAFEFLDAQAVVTLAAFSLSIGARLSSETLHDLAEKLPNLEGYWSRRTFSSMISLLSHGRSSIEMMERLDHYGLLDKVIPEWKLVRYRPQRNAYHTYTVDRHLIEAAVGAGAMRREVKRPDLLILGALLHDIGKGSEGDHSESGAELARAIAVRMGLDQFDVEVIVRVVRHHLLLPDTATRRDISDSKTIQMVAERVQDVTTLELLKVLAEADGRATGPAAWSNWKEDLIERLFQATLAYLKGERVPRTPAFPGEFERSLVQAFDGRVRVETNDDLVWVVAPDRLGLLARVAGTLSLLGLNVIEADVFSEAGVAIERLRVRAPVGREIRWQRFQSELEKSLGDGQELERRLADRAASSARRRKVAPSAAITPRVTIHDDASERATVIEVCAPDSVGLLHRLTSVFARHGLDIVHAKVLTLGDDVVDTFYATGANGRLVSEPHALMGVKADLERALAPMSTGGV